MDFCLDTKATRIDKAYSLKVQNKYVWTKFFRIHIFKKMIKNRKSQSGS